MSAAFRMFPNEIVEIILGFINDPRELLKLQCVCKNWQALITRILSHTTKWRNLCKQQIEGECLRKLIAQLSPSHMYRPSCPIVEDDRLGGPDYWEDVYRAWKKWDSCMEVEPSVDSLLVSDFAIWDDIIGLVFTSGDIQFRKIDCPDRPFFRCMLPNVEGITFWFADQRLIAILQHNDTDLTFWDISNKTELPDTAEGKYVCTNRNYCYILDYDFNTISVFELHSIGIVELCTVEIIPPEQYRSPHCAHGLYVDEFEITVLMKELQVNRARLYEIHKLKLITDENGELMIVHNASNKILENYLRLGRDGSAFILSSNVLVGYSRDGCTAFSVNAGPWFELENLTNYLGSPIASVVLHANLMFCALIDGTIVMFRVNDINDLQRLDFKDVFIKKIKTINAGYYALQVAYSGKIPMLLSHDKESMHIIKFQ